MPKLSFVGLFLIAIATCFWLSINGSVGFAQTSESIESIILGQSFNDMPPFSEGGSVDYIEGINYDTSRIWQEGDYVSDVVKIGDIDTGLNVTQLTLEQIAELAEIDLDDVLVQELGFLELANLEQFLSDVPLLGDWALDDIGLTQKVEDILGSTLSGEETLNSLISEVPELADIGVSEIFGGFSVADIPNLELAQLIDFDGISDSLISEVPGLGDIALGEFPTVSSLAGIINFFPVQDIVFEEIEYSAGQPTPQPVSGGTNGNKEWESIACSGGCAHIELAGEGWAGGNWMTKAHRVRDGYGVLGEMFPEAGAYRLPFGDSFALQIVGTDEAEGAAEWGIAFRVCYKSLFVDLGCTAYFMEVPLGVTTYENNNILAGMRDSKGGSTQPVEAPEGWEDLEPAMPSELGSQVGGQPYEENPVLGEAPPPGEINAAIYQSMGEMGRFDTSAGPDGGNLACAWSVNRILSNAGIQPIGDNPNYVPSVEADLKGGRGQAVNRADAQAGDIVIAGHQHHIGICLNEGCTRVRSNSSSRARFTWDSNTDFNGYYGSSSSRIYRIVEP